MANKIQVKRSAVPDKIPVVGDVDLGELAINTYDGKLYLKKDNGTQSIVEIGGGALTGITSIIEPDFITFDTTPETSSAAPGTLYWDSADGNQTLSLIMANADAVQQIGEELYIRIKASAAISNGQVVMFTGSVGASGALTGAPATGLTALQATYILGIATQNIAHNAWGYITYFGLVRNLNTSAFTDGDLLYYDPSVAGGLTITPPVAPNAKVQIGAVVTSSASVGAISIRLSYGGELGQFEGNVQITSVSDSQFLKYDGAGGHWENAGILAADVPTLNQNTTGTAANVTGVVATANGGTNGTASPTANGVTYGDGTAYAFTAAGTTGQILTATTGSAPTWATPAAVGANPTGTISGAAVNGSATTFLRSDAAPALSLTIAQLNTAVTDAEIATTTATQTFTGGQIGAVTALTSTSNSVAIDLAVNNNFSYATVEASTLAAPSNPVAGQSGAIVITQGATARTLAYNSFYKFAGGTIPTLTATVGAVDTFIYYVESASRATCQLIKDVK